MWKFVSNNETTHNMSNNENVIFSGMKIPSKIISWNALFRIMTYYRKISNIRRVLLGDKAVDHWDVAEALRVGAAQTSSSFST